MGLLAKATAYLERQAAEMQNAAITTKDNVVPTTDNTPTATVVNAAPIPGKRPRHKLRKLAAGLFLGLAVQNATPLALAGNAVTANWLDKRAATIEPVTTQDSTLDKFIKDHKPGLRISDTERDMLAQMLYGEAGIGADPFEILHVVFNRLDSPLFPNRVADILTQKNQFVGYRDTNPVTPAYRRMVDLAVNEREAQLNANGSEKGRKKECPYFYFVTGRANENNMFEICHDHQGKWVAPEDKEYAELGHYCPVAEQQAARYYAQYGRGDARSL